MKEFIVKRTTYYQVTANSKEEVCQITKSGFLKNNVKPVKAKFSVKEVEND